MLNVFTRTAEIVIGIGAVTLFAGLIGKKTATLITGLIIAVLGLAVMVTGMIPNEFAKKIETKAVEIKYGSWDKQVTVIIDKSSDSYRTHHNGRTRKRYLHYITYCTTGGLYTEKDFSERIPYVEVSVNGRLKAVRSSAGGKDYDTVAVKDYVYNNLAEGSAVIVARRKDTIGETVEFLAPEYTPESWKKTYGAGEYYDSSDEFDPELHPRRCK